MLHSILRFLPSKKLAFGDLSRRTPFAYSPQGSPGGKRRKAASPSAHIAGAGMKVGGLRPSDASQKFHCQAEPEDAP